MTPALPQTTSAVLSGGWLDEVEAALQHVKNAVNARRSDCTLEWSKDLDDAHLALVRFLDSERVPSSNATTEGAGL